MSCMIFSDFTSTYPVVNGFMILLFLWHSVTVKLWLNVPAENLIKTDILICCSKYVAHFRVTLKIYRQVILSFPWNAKTKSTIFLKNSGGYPKQPLNHSQSKNQTDIFTTIKLICLMEFFSHFQNHTSLKYVFLDIWRAKNLSLLAKFCNQYCKSLYQEFCKAN